MLELFIVVILSGVFWRYGKEMGSGKWVMVLCFIGTWIGFSCVIPIVFVPVVLSGILTSILGICLSVMSDRKKLAEKKREMELQSKKNACTTCGEQVLAGTMRCFKCGTSRVARG